MSIGLLRSVGADYSVNVPLDHWGYRFIERFEAKGVLHHLGDGIKPFSRLEMATALEQIRVEAKDHLLSTVEIKELAWLRAEFSDVLPEVSGVKTSLSESKVAGATFYQYRHADGAFYLDLLTRQQTDLFSGRGRDEIERVYRNRIGGSVRGHFKQRIGFRIAFEQTREEGSRNYIMRDDVLEQSVELPQLKGDLADYHEGLAYLTFALPFFNIEIGKNEAQWGPAPENNLGLNAIAPTYDMVRLKTTLGALKLVSISGILRPCPDRPDSPVCSGLGDALIPLESRSA